MTLKIQDKPSSMEPSKASVPPPTRSALLTHTLDTSLHYHRIVQRARSHATPIFSIHHTSMTLKIQDKPSSMEPSKASVPLPTRSALLTHTLDTSLHYHRIIQRASAQATPTLACTLQQSYVALKIQEEKEKEKEDGRNGGGVCSKMFKIIKKRRITIKKNHVGKKRKKSQSEKKGKKGKKHKVKKKGKIQKRNDR